MGRREAPVDVATPAGQFAQELRNLRLNAGQPSYRELSRRAGLSPSALSQAASGRRLPPLDLVLAYVEACGGSKPEWRRRWQAVRERLDNKSGTQDQAMRSDRAIPDQDVAVPRPLRVNPDQVATPAELAAALRALVEHAQLTYSDLERLSGGSLRRSTISDLVTGRSLPTWDTADTFITTCRPGIAIDERATWRSAWRRARESAGERTSHAVPRVPMSGCDAYQLGVHRAHLTGDDPSLPRYVARDFDSHLRTAFRGARERGGFIVLVGGSGAGKTRSAYEAARTVVPDFGVLHPADADELRTIPPARSIVWLDELSRYLDSGELTAATMHAMLRSPGPLIVVGTLWPEHYHAFTALPGADQPDRYRQQRQVLRLATVIDVPVALSESESTNAGGVATVDARIAACLDTAEHGLFQVLTAGPHLLRRWRNAASPAATALITAAVNARLAGQGEILTAELLRSAAPAYLTPAQRGQLRSGWFEEAVAYATAAVPGGVAALTPVVHNINIGQITGYRVIDYLVRQREADPDAASEPLVLPRPPQEVGRHGIISSAPPEATHCINAVVLLLLHIDAPEALRLLRIGEMVEHFEHSDPEQGRPVWSDQRRVHRFNEAVVAYHWAAAIFRETGDRHSEGQALSNLGLTLRDLHRFNEAAAAYHRAAAIFHETGDRHSEGQALSNLGLTLRDLHRFNEAAAAYHRAAAIFHETGDRHSEGQALGKADDDADPRPR